MTREQRAVLEHMRDNSFGPPFDKYADAIRAALRDLDAARWVVDEAREVVNCDAVTGMTTDPKEVARHLLAHAEHLKDALAAYDAGSSAGREGET